MRLLEVSDQDDLLSQLRPGVDGLWMEEGRFRATFLPQVWEKLPDPRSFVEQLKAKAGLSKDYWSSDMNWQVYTVISMEESSEDR